MNSCLDPDDVAKMVIEVAKRTGKDPAFLEKQWYALKVVAQLQTFRNDYGGFLVFGGGTALASA